MKCYVFFRAQERPATLILTVTSGLRLTRARHVYTGTLKPEIEKNCSATKNDQNAKNVSITTVCHMGFKLLSPRLKLSREKIKHPAIAENVLFFY